MEGKISLVTFRIGGELYGIDIMDVAEIIRLSEITPIPNSPEFVDGVITLRGQIIPIVDLGKRVHFEKTDFTEDEEVLRAIVIVSVDDMTIGVVIDQVNRVINIDYSQIQPPPQMITGIGAEYIQGVFSREDGYLIMLEILRLFDPKELQQLEGISA